MIRDTINQARVATTTSAARTSGTKTSHFGSHFDPPVAFRAGGSVIRSHLCCEDPIFTRLSARVVPVSSVRLSHTPYPICGFGAAGADETDRLVGFMSMRGALPDEPCSHPPLAAKAISRPSVRSAVHPAGQHSAKISASSGGSVARHCQQDPLRSAEDRRIAGPAMRVGRPREHPKARRAAASGGPREHAPAPATCRLT
jgi:hypothetical protein